MSAKVVLRTVGAGLLGRPGGMRGGLGKGKGWVAYEAHLYFHNTHKTHLYFTTVIKHTYDFLKTSRPMSRRVSDRKWSDLRKEEGG